MSFTIFYKARPIRTAVLVANTEDFDGVCDGIVSWANGAWGARQSVIGLLGPNDTLSNDVWEELVRFDPDQVVSTVEIPDALLAELDVRIRPWLIRGPDMRLNAKKDEPDRSTGSARWHEAGIEAPGIAVPPTEQNLAALGNRPLLLFDFGRECPTLLRRFIHRNLGTYYQSFDMRSDQVRRIGWMEDLLLGIPHERIRVDDINSLCVAMERIAGTPPGRGWKPPSPFTAPCQLNGIYHSGYRARGAFDSCYRVIVGSSLGDFIFYWRNCLNEGSGVGEAPFRHCLWLPEELAREPLFVRALRNWLYHFTGQSSSGSCTVELSSTSVNQELLGALSAQLHDENIRVPNRLIVPSEIEARWRKERAKHDAPPRRIPWLNGDNAERLLAVDRAQTWELRPPELIKTEMSGGSWAVDVQIEREAGQTGVRQTDWWFLPYRSSGDIVRSMFRASVRVSRSGLFAVRVEQVADWHGRCSPARLELRLPNDEHVVPALLLNGRDVWFDHSDARRDRLQSQQIVRHVTISDAGRKLRGLVETFGGFWRARDYWERTFWRELFCQMAGRGVAYDTVFRARTSRTIAKELHGFVREEDREKVAERISKRALGRVGERLPGLALSYVEMETERTWLEKVHGYETQASGTKEIRYWAGNKIVHMSGVRPVTDEELRDGLANLVGLNVLRMGLNQRCPRCRLEHWLTAEDLRQANTCPGCGAVMPLPPETPWRYRLNPLVHHCVNSRALAVWQALSQISDSSQSFFFTPSSELHFSQPLDGAPKRELDVLCITDGELVLGEVKEGVLHEKDFSDFAAIVSVVRSERAIMFVNEQNFKPKAQQWMEGFRKRLAPLGISGELFFLPRY